MTSRFTEMMRKRGADAWGRWLLSAVVVLFSLHVLAGTSAADPSYPEIGDSAFYTVPDDLSPYQRGDLIRWEVEANMDPQVFGKYQTYRIMYRSQGALGEPVAETALVFLNPAQTPSNGWNIVAWAHGTSGQGADCAPSRWPDIWPNDAWKGYAHAVKHLLEVPFMVVAPDYEGMGVLPHVVPSYLNGPSMANSVIDSVLAARQLAVVLGQPISGKFAVLGHSQGGVAARATNVTATPANTQGLTFVGSVEMGGATGDPENVLDLIQYIATQQMVFPYIGYFAASIRAINPEFDYQNLAGPVTLTHMAQAETDCGDPYIYNDGWDANQTPPPLDDILNDPAYRSDPDVLNFATAWSYGMNGVGSNGPALIQQAGDDEFNSATEQQIARAYLCSSGGTIADFITYKGISHDGLISAGIDDAISWLNDRFNGVPATTQCP